MPPLSQRNQLLLAASFALLMILTRGHHDYTLEHLPSASWAIFFLVGLYLRTTWYFGVFFLLATSLDYIAITWGGVSSFCVTGAYLMLLPAYGALWLAGRSYSGGNKAVWRELSQLTLHSIAGTLVCELLSSGGFYFFSGRYVDPSLDLFADRLLTYLPGNFQAVAFYLIIAATLHGLFTLRRHGLNRSKNNVS